MGFASGKGVAHNDCDTRGVGRGHAANSVTADRKHPMTNGIRVLMLEKSDGGLWRISGR